MLHIIDKVLKVEDIVQFVINVDAENETIAMIVKNEVVKCLRKEQLNSNDFEIAQAHLDIIWEKLHTGHWQDVKDCFRTLYAVVSVLKIVIILHISKDIDNALLIDLMKICDMGIMMGNCIMNNNLSKLAMIFTNELAPSDITDIKELPIKRPKLEYSSILGRFENVTKLINHQDIIIEKFKKESDKAYPFLLDAEVNDWPAMEWTFEFFQSKYGHRFVPIEIGKRYTDETWTQTLMPLGKFIEEYIENAKPKNTGYLAQYTLLRQFDELNNDYITPVFCYNAKDEFTDLQPHIWLGPKGTVSPLHTDPRKNLFCQIVGRKHVILFPENQTEFLSPHESNLLNNTSQINLDEDLNDILEKFPKFKNAKGYETVIQPGEALYIPPFCWHFVKSLEKSISLNFWFD